jgi:hypothetical protein
MQKFKDNLANAVDVQHQFLMDVLKKNKDTTYGKSCHFDRVVSPRSYTTIVPLSTHSDYTELLDRVADTGKAGYLTASPPVMLGVTSGTSGKVRWLVTTRELQATFFLSGIAVLFANLVTQFPSVSGDS